MKTARPSARQKSTAGKRPFVLSNFAMTADGKIAFADHSFKPFGSRRDRDHMMELRATADAVMAGARTIEQSQATLGTGGERFRRQRLKLGLGGCHLRVIASGSGSINPDAEIFKHRFSPIIILTSRRISRVNLKKLQAVADEVKIVGRREVDFPAAFRWLYEKYGVRRLLCEGGGELHAALIQAGLVDELHLTFCPQIFGGRTSSTLADGAGFQHLADAAQFELVSRRQKKAELFTVFVARKPKARPSQSR